MKESQSPYGRPLSEVGPLPNRNVGIPRKYQGYTAEWLPGHPDASKRGLVMQHRLIAEAVLGRRLSAEETVHHEDRKKQNNDPANLWLFPSRAAHMRHHKRTCPRYSLDLAERLLPMARDPRVSIDAAARILGVSLSTARALIDVHAIAWTSAATRRLSEKSVREALRGRSTLEAAKALDVNHQTLRNRFPGLLVKRASPGSLEGRKEEIRSLAKSTRLDALSERLGVCRPTISNAIHRWAREEPGAWSEILAFLETRKGLGRPPKRKA